MSRVRLRRGSGRFVRLRRLARRRSVRVGAGLAAVLLLAGILIPILTQRQASAATWWSPYWKYRKQITFNNSASSENLVDFPVRVALTSGTIDYAKTLDTGYDLRFTDSDGKLLHYEIENWNESGTSNVWVKVPQIDAGSTTDSIWMYYGNEGAGDGQNAAGVWSSGYSGVWHMHKDPSGSAPQVPDSTVNDNDATSNGSMASGQLVTGQIGSAIDFDGSDDYLSRADNAILDGTNTMTVSFWTNLDTLPSSTAENMVFVDKSHGSSPWYGYSIEGNRMDSNKMVGGWTRSTAAVNYTGGTTALTNSGWQYITYVKSGTQAAFYRNGSVDTAYSDTHGTTPYDSTGPFYIGGYGANASVDGRIDEVRVSSTNRSAEWVEAEYITQNNTMNSFGSEESGTYQPEGAWTRRRKITMNNSASAENIRNFPLRVSLSAANNNIDYGQTQSNGEDLRFTDSTGTATLSHEIEQWNESGTSEVWVKIPQIDAGSTTDFIWMYYGNSVATDGQQVADVWSNSYEAVYHMSETSGSHQDSSGNDLDTTTTTPTVQGSATGKMAGADEFESSTGSDIVSRSHDANLSHSAFFTVEAWINAESASSTPRTILSKSSSSTTVNYELQTNATDEVRLRYYAGGTEVIRESTTSPLGSTGAFYKVGAVGRLVTVGSFSTSVYVNGASVASGSNSPPSTNTGPLYIGLDTADQLFDGVIDEVRISSAVRTADWMEASYISDNHTMNTYGSEQTGTFLSGGTWAYRRKITLNNVPSAGNLDNFPLRVSLSAAKGNIDYADTQDNGEDIRFVKDDNTTVLPYEIERWDESGTSEAWVGIDQLLAGKQTQYIWMYYGNASATDSQQPGSVFVGDTGTNLKGAWHLQQNPETAGSLGILDSSPNTQNGTMGGSMTSSQSIDGKIGKALDFDGVDDYVQVPYNSNNAPTNVTISAWVNSTVLGDSDSGLFSKTNAGGYGLVNADSSVGGVGFFGFKVYVGGTAYGAAIDRDSVQDNTWIHVTGTYDGETARVYLNGVLAGSNASPSGNISYTSSNSLIMGADADATTTPAVDSETDISLDEARLYSSAQSADWVEAEYRSQADRMATYGPQESPGAARENWCSDATGVTCDTTWQYRRRIEIINVPSGENLANFPVLVKVSGSAVGSQLGNIDYAKTQDDGDDLRFTDPSDPSVVIPHEIETWNESGDSFIWVSVPQIDTGKNSDYIWMYYGNSTVASPATQLGTTAHVTDVWGTDHRMVQHFEESAACPVSFTDSSANSNAGTCVGSPSAATGLAGGGRDFVAANSQYIDINSAADDVASGSFTLDLWFKLTSDFSSSSPADLEIFDLGENASENDFDFFLDSSDGTLSMCALDSNVFDNCISTVRASWTAGVWYHAVATMQLGGGGGMKIYVDGSQDASNGVNSRGGVPSTDFVLGTWRTTTDYFNGVMDEVRVSNTARSGEWVAAEHASTLNSIATYGAEELAPLPPPTLTTLTATGGVSSTPTFQLRGTDTTPNWLRYKIEVCTDADCTSILRTIDQSSSQTGWSGQDADSNTAYVASTTLTSSTLASHTWQTPALTAGQTYWWRAYSTDDTGSYSDASAVSQFQVAAPPAAPTLLSPAGGATGVGLQPELRLTTTDANGDNVKYQIDICSNSDCSSILRTIDQRSSQTGWTSQGVESATAYTAATQLPGSQEAVHIYQAPGLAANTQYWWRAYAYDPTGSDMASAASAVGSFTTGGGQTTRVTGGTIIRGGTRIGDIP